MVLVPLVFLLLAISATSSQNVIEQTAKEYCIFTEDCSLWDPARALEQGGIQKCKEGVCSFEKFEGFGEECKRRGECNKLERCKGGKCVCINNFCYKKECKSAADCENTAHCKGKSCICVERIGCRKRECSTDQDCSTVKTSTLDCDDIHPLFSEKCKCLPSGLCASLPKTNIPINAIQPECPNHRIGECVKKGLCREDEPCKCNQRNFGGEFCQTSVWNPRNFTGLPWFLHYDCTKNKNCNEIEEYKKKMMVRSNEMRENNKALREFNCRTDKDCTQFIFKCQNPPYCKCVQKTIVNGGPWGKCEKI